MDPREQLRLWIKSVSIYKEQEQGPLSAFEQLVDTLDKDLSDVSEAYTRFYYKLIEREPTGSWPDFLFGYILTAENPFSLQCAKGHFLDTESGIRMAVKTDLDLMETLSKIKSIQIKELLFQRFGEDNKDILRLPDWMNSFTKFKVDGSWGDNLLRIAEHYKENGYGRFSVSKIFDVTSEGEIIPMQDIIKLQKNEPAKEALALLSPVFDNLSQGRVENARFGGDPKLLSKAILATLQLGSYNNVKLVRFPQTATRYFTEICDYLTTLPGVFVLFPDNFSALLKVCKPQLEVYFSNAVGLHVKEKNLALFTNQTLTQEEKQWFQFFLILE